MIVDGVGLISASELGNSVELIVFCLRSCFIYFIVFYIVILGLGVKQDFILSYKDFAKKVLI